MTINRIEILNAFIGLDPRIGHPQGGLHRGAVLGAARPSGMLMGGVWREAAVDLGRCPCRMVRTRPAAPRANSPAVVNATW